MRSECDDARLAIDGASPQHVVLLDTGTCRILAATEAPEATADIHVIQEKNVTSLPVSCAPHVNASMSAAAPVLRASVQNYDLFHNTSHF